MDRKVWQAMVHGVAKRVGHDLETREQQRHRILTDVKGETGSNTKHSSFRQKVEKRN